MYDKITHHDVNIRKIVTVVTNVLDPKGRKIGEKREKRAVVRSPHSDHTQIMYSSKVRAPTFAHRFSREPIPFLRKATWFKGEVYYG